MSGAYVQGNVPISVQSVPDKPFGGPYANTKWGALLTPPFPLPPPFLPIPFPFPLPPLSLEVGTLKYS